MEYVIMTQSAVQHAPSCPKNYPQIIISSEFCKLALQFLGWLDRSSSSFSVFLEVSTSNSGSLTLSASHVIFRSSFTFRCTIEPALKEPIFGVPLVCHPPPRLSKTGALETVYAGQLNAGDKLVQMREGEVQLKAEEVVSVKEVLDSGHWAPLTSSGTLLVDGFLASSYASFPHDYSQVGQDMIPMQDDCFKELFTGCICPCQAVFKAPARR